MFYLLNKEQADTIGKFEFSENSFFSPYELVNNDYFYVSELMYNLLKDLNQFKKVDFSNLPKTDTIPTQTLKP